MKRLMLVLAWYALIPPLAGDLVDVRAPLGQWEQLWAFDAAQECERVATTYARQIEAQTDNVARARYQRVQYIRCVSAADPRLREVAK